MGSPDPLLYTLCVALATPIPATIHKLKKKNVRDKKISFFPPLRERFTHRCEPQEKETTESVLQSQDTTINEDRSRKLIFLSGVKWDAPEGQVSKQQWLFLGLPRAAEF